MILRRVTPESYPRLTQSASAAKFAAIVRARRLCRDSGQSKKLLLPPVNVLPAIAEAITRTQTRTSASQLCLAKSVTKSNS